MFASGMFIKPEFLLHFSIKNLDPFSFALHFLVHTMKKKKKNSHWIYLIQMCTSVPSDWIELHEHNLFSYIQHELITYFQYAE